MGKKKKEPPPPTGGLEQNGLDKRLCNCICLMQLVSIISGVALLYLSVIVVSPSKMTLDAEFDANAAVCTTLENVLSTNCTIVSCGEWCLSKGGSTCQIIYAKVRRQGQAVTFKSCTEVKATFCSSQVYNKTQQFICSQGDEKVGECDQLDRFMDCSLIKNNETDIKSNLTSLCRNITAIKDCTVSKGGSVTPQQEGIKTCSRYTCNELNGIYECSTGNCKKLENPNCVDRCSELQMGNMAVSTPDLFQYGTCGTMEVNGTEVWKKDDQPIVMYCSKIRNVSASELQAEDCVNGALLPQAEFANLKDYKQVLEVLEVNSQQLGDDMILPSEKMLEIFNRTKVMINIEGCVNTLQKECTSWLADKGRDGSNGMYPAVYPCHTTPFASQYVITNYDRAAVVASLVMAAAIPASIMIFSCVCLCLCGKTVGVNQYGLFYCKPCHKETGEGGKEPGKPGAP